MKRTIIFLFSTVIFSVTSLLMQQSMASAASTYWADYCSIGNGCYGHFTGTMPGCIYNPKTRQYTASVCSNAVDVLPNGVPATASTFISIIHTDLYSGGHSEMHVAGPLSLMNGKPALFQCFKIGEGPALSYSTRCYPRARFSCLLYAQTLPPVAKAAHAPRAGHGDAPPLWVLPGPSRRRPFRRPCRPSRRGSRSIGETRGLLLRPIRAAGRRKAGQGKTGRPRSSPYASPGWSQAPRRRPSCSRIARQRTSRRRGTRSACTPVAAASPDRKGGRVAALPARFRKDRAVGINNGERNAGHLAEKASERLQPGGIDEVASCRP